MRVTVREVTGVLADTEDVPESTGLPSERQPGEMVMILVPRDTFHEIEVMVSEAGMGAMQFISSACKDYWSKKKRK